MNLYEQISEWLKNYEHIGSWIYFNVTNYEAGCISLNSVTSSRYLRKFIDGSQEVELVFAIDMVNMYDAGTSTTNLEALQEVKNFSDWIELQNKLKSFPDFGTKREISDIAVLDDCPSITINADGQTAKYQFQVKITYKEY